MFWHFQQGYSSGKSMGLGDQELQMLYKVKQTFVSGVIIKRFYVLSHTFKLCSFPFLLSSMPIIRTLVKLLNVLYVP